MSVIYWIIEFAAAFAESLLCFVFCGVFTDREKLSTKKNLILWLSILNSGIIISLNTITLFSEITSFSIIAIMLILQYIVYKHPLRISIFVLTYFAIMIAINFSIAYSVAYISELSLDKILLEHSLLRAITVAISKNLLIITICVIYKFKIKEKNLPNKYLLGLFAFSVLIIFLLLFVGFKYMYFDADDLNVSFALFFIISLFLILMFFFGTIKTAEHYENKQQIELLALRNQMLETSMAETEKTFTLWQSSLHDHKYKIISLLNLLNENKFNELKNELEEENELLSQNLFYYKTGNNAVDSILNIKRTLACEYGITFLINAVLPEKCCITDTHLSIILGNLIDNAISASLNEQNPYIEVSIKMVKDYLTIKVKNRFTQNKEQPKKPTADTHFHGIGQKSVEHIVNNYSGEFRIDIDKESYSVLIIVLDKSNIN